MSEPSVKQRILAEKIQKVVNRPLPKEYTARAYWKYINGNYDLYRLGGCGESTQEEAEAFDEFQY